MLRRRQRTRLASRAIDRGAHVLIEKPGGRNIDDAEEIARLGAQSEKVIWVGYNRRFNPSYRSIRDMLKRFPTPAGAIVSFESSLSVVDWSSISGYLGESNQGGDVVRDLVSHQLDLLAWVFSSPVISVRCQTWDQNGAAAEWLIYDVRLGTGVTIQCLAEHGERYRESLAIEIGKQKLLSYPTGLLRTERANWRALELWAEVRYWIDRKLIRAGMLADPQQLSYHDQLEAFATAVRGGRPKVKGTSGDSLLMTYQSMRALLEGRAALGEWRPATRDS